MRDAPKKPWRDLVASFTPEWVRVYELAFEAEGCRKWGNNGDEIPIDWEMPLEAFHAREGWFSDNPDVAALFSNNLWRAFDENAFHWLGESGPTFAEHAEKFDKNLNELGLVIFQKAAARDVSFFEALAAALKRPPGERSRADVVIETAYDIAFSLNRDPSRYEVKYWVSQLHGRNFVKDWPALFRKPLKFIPRARGRRSAYRDVAVEAIELRLKLNRDPKKLEILKLSDIKTLRAASLEFLI